MAGSRSKNHEVVIQQKNIKKSKKIINRFIKNGEKSIIVQVFRLRHWRRWGARPSFWAPWTGDFGVIWVTGFTVKHTYSKTLAKSSCSLCIEFDLIFFKDICRGNGAKVPQILKNMSQKHTGTMSVVPAFLGFAGCSVRVRELRVGDRYGWHGTGQLFAVLRC